jgi:hypothetical protein
MSDRKYRQRGYQDEPRDREQRKPDPPRAPAGPRDRTEPRKQNFPGFRHVAKCARCGNVITADIVADSRCTRCGADLRTCAQCTHFDPGSRFECAQAVPARVSPKDQRNTCELFDAKVTLERETGSTAPTSARQAFDDLFK